jgi:hypothetical protein
LASAILAQRLAGSRCANCGIGEWSAREWAVTAGSTTTSIGVRPNVNSGYYGRRWRCRNPRVRKARGVRVRVRAGEASDTSWIELSGARIPCIGNGPAVRVTIKSVRDADPPDRHLWRWLARSDLGFVPPCATSRGVEARFCEPIARRRSRRERRLVRRRRRGPMDAVSVTVVRKVTAGRASRRPADVLWIGDS